MHYSGFSKGFFFAVFHPFVSLGWVIGSGWLSPSRRSLCTRLCGGSYATGGQSTAPGGEVEGHVTTEVVEDEAFYDDDDDDDDDDWRVDDETAMRTALYEKLDGGESGSSHPITADGDGDGDGSAAAPVTTTRNNDYVSSSTLQEICDDYSLPIAYLADVCCTFGASPPIQSSSKLGDLINGEQCFALIEAINSVDPMEISAEYFDGTVEEVYEGIKKRLEEIKAGAGEAARDEDFFDVFGGGYDGNDEDDYDDDDFFQGEGKELQLSDVMFLCRKRGYNLPFGSRTTLRFEQVRALELYYLREFDDDDE